MCFAGLLELAGAMGLVRAYNEVGVLFREGKYVEQDHIKAVQWFQKGANAVCPLPFFLFVCEIHYAMTFIMGSFYIPPA